MRLGGYQLRGVRKRFWFALGGLALVIFLAITLWPRSPAPEELWFEGKQTAFSEIGLPPAAPLRDPGTTVDEMFADDRLGDCGEGNMQCIYYVQDGNSLYEYLQSPNQLGVPFRFRAYLPSQEATSDGAEVPLSSERQSLFSEKFSEGGWRFRPAIVLDALNLNEAAAAGGGFDPLTLDSQAANTLSLSDDGFIAPGGLLLGFQGGLPASGAIYDFDAMLFGMSNAVERPGTAQYAAEPVPAMLVRDFQRVSSEEVLEPASERAELDITYSVGNRYQLALHGFEWPADGNARMCLTLSNISPAAIPIWEGLFEGVQLRIGGVTLLGTPAPGSRFEVGAENTEMQIGESISGYIIFGLEQEGSEGNVGTVSGSPREQEVRLSIASLLQGAPGTTFTNQQVFVGISDGEGGSIPFERVLSSQESFISPLSSSETCSE